MVLLCQIAQGPVLLDLGFQQTHRFQYCRVESPCLLFQDINFIYYAG